MHAPPPPAYLLRLLLTTATFRRQGITTRRGVARLAALRYGGESASVPGCLCDGTGGTSTLTACSLWYDHNPIAVCLHRESPCFAGRLPDHEHCSGKK